MNPYVYIHKKIVPMFSQRGINTHVLHTGAASDPLPGFKRVAACKVATNPSVEVISMDLSNLMSKPKADRPSYQEPFIPKQYACLVKNCVGTGCIF